MTSKAPSETNNTRSIVRAPGQKRVRIAAPDSSNAEDTTTELNFSPTTAPSITFKTMASKSLQTHLPQLNEFLKPIVESFGSTYANAFFKQLKSDELMVGEVFVPSSAKFKFEPKLLDSIMESEEAATLLASCADYVHEVHQALRKFARTAFDLNNKEIKGRLVKKLGSLLHGLATGLIAKYNAKGYDPDVAVMDFLSLHPDEITSSVKTTPYLFLKHYRELRKLPQLPEPTMPAQDTGHIWRAVNAEASRDAVPRTRDAAPPAASPAQTGVGSNIPPAATAETTATPEPTNVTPAKRSSPGTVNTITVLPNAHALAIVPMATPSPEPGGMLSLSQKGMLEFAAANPEMTMAEVLKQREEGGAAINLFGLNPPSHPLLTNGPELRAAAPAPAPAANAQNVNGLSQNNDTFYAAAEDADAMETNDATATAAAGVSIPSGRSVVLTELYKNFGRLVIEPTRCFVNQHTYREEHIRIQRATLPQALESNAEDIAEQVNGERALPPRNMRGLVRAEAHKINDTTTSEIASLRAQVEKLTTESAKKKKKEKKKNKDTSASSKKDFHRSRGKAAATGSANHHRGRAAGPGNATKHGKRGSSRGRSRSRSVGRKGASSTKKRS